jgi:hypothetical protein
MLAPSWGCFSTDLLPQNTSPPPTAIKRQTNVDNVVKCVFFFVLLEGCVSLKPFFRLQFVTQKLNFINLVTSNNKYTKYIRIILRERPNARCMAKCWRIFANDCRWGQYYCLSSDRDILNKLIFFYWPQSTFRSIELRCFFLMVRKSWGF